MGDEAMTDARNSVERKKKMETGTAGLYVAGHGSQAVWDGKGDEKRAEGRGRGACVGFVVSDRCPPMFGEIFLLLFFNGLGRRVGRTLMRYKKRSNTTKTTNSRLWTMTSTTMIL